ncbi:gamma-glutamyltransferase [Paludifilum halophilum]|uniref:Glutathione hydrolase proenzyme n=1 Tax=Paludifilum halophilum TaxID=1642702 RepID=A0A235BCB3_9BACL|nr:gamma-glutamyltransferase [Paludifilum halophilum]OYD09931.1 gamma-glutamyltransferase [Paludifilum halophilum]
MKTKTLNILLSVIVVLGMTGFYLSEAFGKDPSQRRLYDTSLFEKGGGEQGYSVASAHPLATDIGMDILARGGNAVDAAIAISYALGVVEPHGSGIGGGGTMLVYPADGKEPVIYDYREVSPYSGARSTQGIGIPGFVLGMETAHNDFGSVKMADLIDPSIQLARQGHPITSIDESRIERAAYRMPTADLPNYYPNGVGLKEGEILKQEELARTMEQIQQQGSDVFYKGAIGREIAGKVDSITMADLARYRVEKKKPVRGTFAGYEVLAPPAPSGGIMLIQMLQMAESLQIDKTKDLKADFVHLTGEIYKRSYRDRLQKIGDPDFVDVPQQRMTTVDHAEELAADIPKKKLSQDLKLKLDSQADQEDHDNTTHFVVVDQNGMMVSATNTVSHFFGSGVYVKGFFLNNQLKNFSLTQKYPNRYEPGKRPYSYTTPSVLVKKGESVIGIGSAGGRRIPAMVSQTLIRHLKYGMPIQEALKAPRSYVKIEDNTVAMEKEFPDSVRTELSRRGYPATATSSPLYFGSIQVIKMDLKTGRFEGGADPRRDGTWSAEY